MQIVINLSKTLKQRIDMMGLLRLDSSYVKEVSIAISHGTIIPQGLEPLITKLIEDAKEVENG